MAAGRSGTRPPAAAVARWPLELDGGVPDVSKDPWVEIVRTSLEDYGRGRADRASRSWADALVWRLAGNGPLAGDHVGPEEVFAYHRRLGELTSGTFRQRLVALEGGNGPIVEAHLQTTARRGDRTLDVPTLVVFELCGGQIRTVTELPGDQSAWDRFWSA